MGHSHSKNIEEKKQLNNVNYVEEIEKIKIEEKKKISDEDRDEI